ncbi:GNAT family N-acetyltransferase [Sporolactobacillus kofuensis]|uniref:GNAT family N-acetyltransferase n=1 Tax=Sporolactobacillus kofuensis TaxID=269672 RepID=A0ABW1WDZ8_9BACL|nr:GNAT family N-acetyltransferase [Sporolactobacillus kofuensis]MCO7174963.1 GNAT family N-acetyltransferase [Sporolactobacillus kofuensis]
MVTIDYLSNERIHDFVAYCKKHRMDVDDSYLYDEDLEHFEPDEENPTYILTDENDMIVGAASLLMDEYYQKSGRGRFRIFHCESNAYDQYQMLLNAIKQHTQALTELSLFIQTTNAEMMANVEKLQFTKWRYSFLLVKENLTPLPVALPEGFVIRPFQPGKDEDLWAEVRNSGFAKLLGSETPITANMVKKMVSESDYLEDGMLILYHGNQPIGIVRGADDEYEGAPIMNIGPLAIIPSYQGQGLGRAMLRSSLNFAHANNYSSAVLCVNGENERAKTLYTHEGFKQVESVVCYTYSLKN